MNLKIFLLRFAGLILFTIMGGLLVALTLNVLIMIGVMPDAEGTDGFGKVLMRQTAFVYMASIVAGFAGIFVRDSWRWVLYLSPLYAPAVFTAIYTTINA